MRARVALSGAVAAVALSAAAEAQAPPPISPPPPAPVPAPAPAPTGNFGGGALVAPPNAHFGPGNAVVALRALPDRKLEIEATVRASCAGGDVAAGATVAADGSFSARGTERTEPERGVKVTTTYTLTGTFSTPSAADGTLSATIERRAGGRTRRCRTGSVTFGVRRPAGTIGTAGKELRTRYYGTTSQRGAGPLRPIVLRLSGDGLVISRALFGESVRCSDRTRSTGIEAPRTNARIDAKGRVDDHERYEIKQGNALVKVDDRFTAQLGSTGARGTFSLSDRTTDRTTGRVLQSCKSGEIKWTAEP
ncbi:MAG TPA: hypothetical protein VGO81_17330 [Solirubrobacteraceae bacterium]|nr:hypothetical protein [Solirubrobacteraceae bacterium]